MTNAASKTGPAMPGRGEFVVIVSSVMMVTALAIDSMLPALPAIGHGLGVSEENQRQLVISSLLVGFTAMQLFAGMLTDRFGRRNLMLYALLGFSIASLAAALAPSFPELLVARVAQGMTAAIAQVVIRSVVRDRFEGREMAQVMSMASSIFMLAPILAPAMGQLVLEIAPWRWIFGILGIFGVLTWVWVLLRLPETLGEAARTPIAFAPMLESARRVMTDRMSLGYSLASACLAFGLFGFLLTVQQVFEHVLKAPEKLPLGFAIMAVGMAGASLANAAIVRRFGMRLIGHAALIWYILFAGIHFLVALSGQESFWSFVGLQMLMMIGFAFVMGNFGAMAMERMGDVAGMANSLQGTLTNFIGLAGGTLIGMTFAGTTVPLYLACFVCGLIALGIVFVTEGGRLFVARHPEPEEQ
jgi:MFS transporter, DHA1 family, multidrug resistance protein